MSILSFSDVSNNNRRDGIDPSETIDHQIESETESNRSDKCHIATTLPAQSICIKGCATKSLSAYIKMILDRKILILVLMI